MVPLALRRALGLCALLSPALAVADPVLPEDPGPVEVRRESLGFVPLVGLPLPVDAYLPDTAPAPSPVVVVLHGAGRTGHYMGDLASTLASRGVVALVPDFPCLPAACDHAGNAARVSDLLAYAVSASASGEGPLAGRIDADRRGVIGHSWGGLAVLLAAASDATIGSVVLLDPNDDFLGQGASVLDRLAAPTAVVRAERPSVCNSLWPSAALDALAVPRLGMTVVDAGHCDVESPTDPLCATACGFGTSSTTPFFRRYAVAFTTCALTADADVSAYVGGAALAADEAAGLLTAVRADGLDAMPCRVAAPPAPDAAGANDAAGAAANDAAKDAAGPGANDAAGPGANDAAGPGANDAAGPGANDATGAGANDGHAGGAPPSGSTSDASRADAGLKPLGASGGNGGGCALVAPGRPPALPALLAGASLLAAGLRRRRVAREHAAGTPAGFRLRARGRPPIG